MGSFSSLSWVYIPIPRDSCFMLLTQAVRRAASRAWAKTGQQHAGEDGDDRDDHEKFNEGEALASLRRRRMQVHGQQCLIWSFSAIGN